MSPAAKLAGFAILLAAVFGVAAIAGGAIDPDRGASAPAHGSEAADGDGAGAHGAGRGANAADGTGHGAGHGAGAARGGGHGGADAVRGLAVAQDGLRLVVATPELPARRAARLAFRIVGSDGRTVRDVDLEHERRMHVIVARRDLRGFQHLHPRMADDGTWSTPIRVGAPGSYRLFADFATGGEPVTLASDLRVDGDAALAPLPPPATAARSDGGDAVALSAAPATLRAGRDQTLRFAVERDGRPVELERYLGAGGHLVALREGDLGFLHVHPTGPPPAAARPHRAEGSGHAHAPGAAHGDAGPGTATHGTAAHGGPARGEVAFATAFPTPGRYRLFLQYQVDGRVETVAFTVKVAR